MSNPPSITSAELAQRVQGTLVGSGNLVLHGVAPLAEAGPDDVSWLGKLELLPRLAHSAAGVVLVPEECTVRAGRTVIRVSDPDVAICEVLAALQPPIETVPPGVDATAWLGAGALVDGASIGPNVRLGAGAVVGPGTQLHAGVYVGAHVQIGRDCVLWPNVVVREYTTIGDRVIIHPNATIGADGFGYHQRQGRHVKIPQIGRVLIADDVEIGANSCIDRARSGTTSIGRGTKIDNLVQIGHNARIGEDCIIVSQCGISGSTVLGHHVVLAGQVGLVDHITIGNHVSVGAKSGVAESIPDGQVYRGIPALDHRTFARQAVGIRWLPKIIEQLRALNKRMEQLESATHDPARR